MCPAPSIEKRHEVSLKKGNIVYKLTEIEYDKVSLLTKGEIILPGIREVWFFANNIIRTSRLILNESLRPLGLSSAEGNILLELAVGGDGLRQEDLVGRLDISKSAVSRALDSLENKGLVFKKPHPTDRRASLVFVSLQGRRLEPQLESVYQGLFAAAARGISEEEVARFTDLFRRVSENLTRARQAGRQGGGGGSHVG